MIKVKLSYNSVIIYIYTGCKDKNGDCVYESGIVNTTACTQHTCTRTGWQLNSYGNNMKIVSIELKRKQY